MLRNCSPLFALTTALAVATTPSCHDGTEDPNVLQGDPASLKLYHDCHSLELDLKDMLLEDALARADGYGYWGLDDGAGEADPSSDQGGDSRDAGEDFSGTNNQEDGVDEADFVKTDGYRIYVLNGNRMHIFGVPEFGDLVPAGVAELEGYPREMLLNRDTQRAVVFSQIYPYSLPEDHPLRDAMGIEDEDGGWYWRTDDVTKVTVFDVANEDDPQVISELYLEGWYSTARLVDSAVRMSNWAMISVPSVDRALWTNVWNWENGEPTAAEREWILRERKKRIRRAVAALSLEDLIPRRYLKQADGSFKVQEISEDTCKAYARPADSRGRGVTSLLSLDLASDKLKQDADYIVSNWPTFYASKERVYIAEPANDWWFFWAEPEAEDQTNIHAFNTSKPGRASYLGSGRVDGLAWDQFNFSEHDGYLRVATTANLWGRWWQEDPEEPETHVHVLELERGRLRTVGHIGGIAPGERLFASRFTGDRGYLVTFEQIDPLFTLDMSNPREPKVIGELEIPGFSTYLHPVSDERLLAVGVGGDETGANWRAQVSLFDVGNFAEPAMADRMELVSEGEWGWSEALYEHKAFQFFKGKLAVPVANYANIDNGDGTWSYNYTSELVILSVGDDPLSEYGTIDHSDFFNSDSNTWWANREVRRSIFMGDFIYAISDRGITAHQMSDLGQVSAATLPGYQP